MPTRDEMFERWLRSTTRHTVAATRRTLVERDDDDEAADDDVADDRPNADLKGAGADDSTTTADAAAKPAETRGGPQKARAAQREVPAPGPDDLTMEVVVDKLNAIRSGKSLKDEGVRKRIGEYFNELTSAQRLALFAFLEGLAEVVASDVPGDDARAPNDPDIGVEMERGEASSDEPAEPRVAKHDAEEYSRGRSSGGEKVVVRSRASGSQARPRSDAPAVAQDAGDEAPVHVVHR